jgi:hypothetical protein
MKQLLLLFLLLIGFSKSSFGQTGFAFDSLANPHYICQASAFDVEVFGWRADGSTQNGSQNYFVSNDTVYVQFHFVAGVGPAVPTPLYRKINVPAPLNFGIYKIVVQGIANGQVLQTLTSAISICSGMLAVPEKLNRESEFSLFPNPAREMLHISFPENKERFTASITDVTGKTLLTKTFKGRSTHHLNLEALPQGIYFLQLQTEAGSTIKRIVKQ